MLVTKDSLVNQPKHHLGMEETYPSHRLRRLYVQQAYSFMLRETHAAGGLRRMPRGDKSAASGKR
jgi:hypothetical protein